MRDLLDPEVRELHRSCHVLDLHADTPALLRMGYDLGVRHAPPLPLNAWGFHVDLPRMEQGGLTAQFFGLVSLPVKLPFRPGPAAAIDRLLDALERAEGRYADRFVLVRTAAEIRAAKVAGKRAGLRGIEGAHALEGDLDKIGHFAGRGVAYLGLLHFSSNEVGAPAYGKGSDDSVGLTAFGRDVVDELNRHKIIVDLAHINRHGFMEAAARSRHPVIVSHTGVTGVNPHWRNIDDEQLRAVAETGGCAGVIFSRRFLGVPGLDGICAHLEHMIKVGGEDLPALGSDFDGLVTPPAGMDDVSRLPSLTDRLWSRGVPPHQIRKIMGENALRVLSEVAG